MITLKIFYESIERNASTLSLWTLFNIVLEEANCCTVNNPELEFMSIRIDMQFVHSIEYVDHSSYGFSLMDSHTGQLLLAKGELEQASAAFKIVLDGDRDNVPALLGQVFRLLFHFLD